MNLKSIWKSFYLLIDGVANKIEIHFILDILANFFYFLLIYQSQGHKQVVFRIFFCIAELKIVFGGDLLKEKLIKGQYVIHDVWIFLLKLLEIEFELLLLLVRRILVMICKPSFFICLFSDILHDFACINFLRLKCWITITMILALVYIFEAVYEWIILT